MIRPVSYAAILDDPSWPALLAEYAAECSIPELGEPHPQRELYELLENSGGFQAFGVYDGDVLIGFACVLIYVLPHYGKKIATTESLFVSKSNRSAYGWIQLRSFIKQYAIDLGCGAFMYSAPVGSRFDRWLAVVSHHTNNVYLETL